MTSDTFVSTSSARTPQADESDNSNNDGLRPMPDIFTGFVHAVDIERTSLSRKFENVQCWLACDDTASVNLYLDLQKELDYVDFKLTQNIRNVYFSSKTNIIKLHLNSKMRLDITLTRMEHGQKLFDQLTKIKARPPDLVPDLIPFAEPSTPSRKRVIQHFIPSTESEHTTKKTRAVISQDLFRSYRHSKEVADPVLSSSPPEARPTPERWRIPSSPACGDAEIITPNRALVFDKFARIGHSTFHMPDLVPRPQFHAKVPTARVLRSMNDRSKRYGREVDNKSSKDSGVLEKFIGGGSRCIYAVVQAMLCLNPLVPDLTDSYLLLICGVQDGLFKSFTEAHAAFSETGQLKIKEDEISNSIVKSSAGSLGGEIDDAREFLNDCLSQVQKEFSEREECPITQAFGGKIDRISECANCGNMTCISEKYHDLQLDVPAHEGGSARSNRDTVSIGSLVPQLFDTKPVECSKCHSDQATMHRSLSQLPEVLVLCLKRFSSNPSGGFKKHRSHVTIDATLEFNSDDEDAIFIASQQSQESFSFYEAPTEEEQYQWAMEESIRASQITSQNSVADYRLKDEEDEDEDESVSSQVFGENNPFARPDFASRITRSRSGSQRTSAHSSKIGTPKVSPKLELPDRKDTFVVHEDKDKGVGLDDGNKKINGGGDGDDDGDGEDDEQIKAVLLASLTEKDIQEQEEKEFEEAIRRSLLDQEDNKENISPDKAASQKKLEKKKMAAALTRSCSQLDTSILNRHHHRHQAHHLRKRPPAQLKRSITIPYRDILSADSAGAPAPDSTE
ncbi:Ubiquitin carboxyl-terminal hydrolase 37 [Linnemannia zychae]|nr:Ubiquitin carboxyl-terminal hydrolase 37 [Linnemannia zychae]